MIDEIRELLETHRQDALVLLQTVSRTAQLYEGFRLAGAVGHLARAQELLSEELEGLPRKPEPKPVSPQSRAASTFESQDDTPLNGIHPSRSKG